MEKCLAGLKGIGKQVKFRALYIEKNAKAYSRLSAFVENYNNPSIEVKCKQGDYSELINEIVAWCGGHFTFFFVDPMGWKKINAITLSPLLQIEKSEFLINLMYDFANRAASIENHGNDMINLLGEVPNLEGQDSAERQDTILTMYRKMLNAYYEGKSSYVQIERPGQDRVLYFLVYLTRHPIGICKFKEEAEKLEMVQRATHAAAKFRIQMERTKTADLFADEGIKLPGSPDRSEIYIRAAKEYLLASLSETPVVIDFERWASFLESTNLLHSDLQNAMKQLVDEGKVQNLDADVRRRRKHVVKPNWPNKSERWSLVKKS
jgi:three-Cys-motif partner protein